MYARNEQVTNSPPVVVPVREMEPVHIALLKMARLGLRTQDPRQVAKLDQLISMGLLQHENPQPPAPGYVGLLGTYWLTEAGKGWLAQHQETRQ